MLAMWYSRFIVLFFRIEFVSPCAKRECFLDWDKRIFFSIKYLQSYHILSFLFEPWLSCTVVSSCLKFLITFLFLGSCALLFQLFPSCHSYFLFYVVPFCATAFYTSPPAVIWTHCCSLGCCRAVIPDFSLPLYWVGFTVSQIFSSLFPVQVTTHPTHEKKG